MRFSKVFRLGLFLAAAAVLTYARPVAAANYPLEITNIKPAGGLHGASRIYRAYPGLEYNIRVAVIGGAYPYSFALTAAPEGMTIDGRGVISWVNPQGNANATIVVRDSEGSQVSVTWPITVSTSGFRFVSATSGSPAPTGAGTFANPWRTLSDVYYNAGPTDIVYFRAGNYDQLSLPRTSVGSPWERVEWGSNKALMWLSYPGERPLINFGYRAGVERGPLLRISGAVNGPHPYIDGFDTVNTSIIGFQTESPATFRRLRMHDLLLGGDGTNAAFIMTLTQPTPAVGMVIQECEFYNVPVGSVTIKIYAQERLLIEDTIHHHADVAVELKDDVRRYTVRGNRFYGITNTALGGNMHETTTNGEICFNNIAASQHALDVNQDGMAGITYIYRNTLVGRVRIRNTDAADGPFYLRNNVIINSDGGTPSGSHVYHESVTAPSRVVLSNNLAGYANQGIVDANGLLTAAYGSYMGTHGHQTGPGGSIDSAPRAPANVTIIR